MENPFIKARTDNHDPSVERRRSNDYRKHRQDALILVEEASRVHYLN